jgi:hypothetical protein
MNLIDPYAMRWVLFRRALLHFLVASAVVAAFGFGFKALAESSLLQKKHPAFHEKRCR